MAKIDTSVAIVHHSLSGVLVYPLLGGANRGSEQEVLVVVEPLREIPLHTHEVDAKMFIVAGSGTVLSGDQRINRSEVRVGDLVFFEKRVSHGFVAGPEGLSFVSKNGGIVDANQDNWDIEFTH
jgi:quercetin dioxygenase-like cupin family protein